MIITPYEFILHQHLFVAYIVIGLLLTTLSLMVGYFLYNDHKEHAFYNIGVAALLVMGITLVSVNSLRYFNAGYTDVATWKERQTSSSASQYVRMTAGKEVSKLTGDAFTVWQPVKSAEAKE